MLRREHTEAKAEAGRRLPDAADEIALIRQVAGGDTTAFETLFRRYYPRLRRFLERMTRRPQLVDEIVNDTMLVVWRKADTFNLRSKLSTWIIGIALRRSLKALERVNDAIDFDPDAAASPAESGPEGNLLRQELRMRLSQALMSLSPEQRAVIELTYYEGCTYREIAAIVGCPVDTVKTRMFYARRRLKSLLAERGEEAA
ncbi:MAG TPA: sigma-70 family RNA polymerase sigma factor [Casimicrobiaceae bacterium]|jgi:RNA polymerase sigma-70 factor (ECF subfamily)|nr:sigma-70 family RNA polymerase sigma factor [Casimicrobiaceae bacterium]